MKGGRVFRSVLAALAASAVLASLVSGFFLARGRLAVSRLEDRIGLLKAENVPLRFMVLSRSDQAVSARFRFYDADGREISMFERSWNGSELAVDSVIVPVGGRYLAFPSRVFTDDTAPRRGTELFGYYDRGGFPAVFDSAALDAAARRALSVLFARVRAYDSGGAEADGETRSVLKGAFGGAAHDLKRLREFEIGAVYALVSRANGGIEIIRE